MVQTALTDKALEKFSPKSRAEYWDAYLEGFGYRTSAPGKGSFFVMFRLDGKQRRMTIGRYPTMSLADARARAKTALQAAKENRDPALEEAERARDEGHKRSRTLTLAVDDFLKLYPKYKASTRAEVGRLLKREVVTTLGGRPVSSITRRDVAKVINAVSDRGAGTTANRLLAYLGAFFNWLVERGELDATPITNLAKPSEERTRDRILSDDELRAVWLAADEVGYAFGRVVQLLILTGQRRDEVAGMLRSNLDLSEPKFNTKGENITPHAAIWTLSREQTKSGRRHEVPLAAAVRDIIEGLPDRGSDMLFKAMSVRKSKDPMPRHISGWSSYKRSLDERAKAILKKDEDDDTQKEGRGGKAIILRPYVLHDLRRTFASGMGRLGIAPHVVERLLNHSSGTIRGVAAIYNRHTYAPEMRHAADLWASYVAGLLVPAASNVIALRG